MRIGVAWFAAGVLAVGLVSSESAGADGNPSFSSTLGYDVADSYRLDVNNSIDSHTAPDLFAANREGFSLLERDQALNIDLFQFGISGQRGRVGYSAKVGLGDFTSLIGHATDSDLSLKEAYVTINGGAISTRVGRFLSPLGYKVAMPSGDGHISRSRGWVMQPTNHDGITLDGRFDAIDFTVGLVDRFGVGGDTSDRAADDEKGLIAALGADLSDQVNIYVSGIYTEEGNADEIGLVNGVVSGILDPAGAGLRYALEGNYVEHDFGGGSDATGWNVGVYGGADMGPLGLDVRWDYSDFSGDAGSGVPALATGGDGVYDADPFAVDWSSIAASGLDTEIWSVTVTGSVSLADAVEFRLEYRHDDSAASVFLDDDASNDTLDVVQAQVVWHPVGN